MSEKYELVFQSPHFEDVGVDDSVLRWRTYQLTLPFSADERSDEEAIKWVDDYVVKRGTVLTAYLPNATKLGIQPVSLTVTRVVKQW